MKRDARGRTVAAMAGLLAGVCVVGCAAPQRAEPPLADPPTYARDHRYTLDELVELSIHHNASLDVARYEAEAAQGLVDQVKALWLPTVRYDFAATAFNNDMNYRIRALNIVPVDVPLTSAFNLTNSLLVTQILTTGGKRISGLKQAKFYAALKRIDVLRQQDAVAQDVANYYLLVCLTTDVDRVLEDTLRRIRVFRQVAGGLNERGSLRTSNLDSLEADFVVSLIEQLQIAVRAGRQQAHAALKQTVGFNPDQPLELARISLPEGPRVPTWLSVATTIVQGFTSRPENREVDLFTKIREQQVVFAKAAWAPNIVFAGNVIDITGNSNSILNAVDGIAATFLVDVPIYDSSRRARLREALGLEQASLAFQRQVEQLLTLEIEVTALEAQRAAATALRSARASQVAAEHYDASRQAYSRELIPASGVVIALGLDAVAKLGHLQSVYSYEYAQAKLKRVTADRETRYGY